MANSAWVTAAPHAEPIQVTEYKLAFADGVDIAASLDLDKAIEIIEVRVHTSLVEANTLTGIVNSDTGAAYDFTPISQSFAAITDYRYAPTVPLHVGADASFDLALTITAGTTSNVSILAKV
jgi:hypothetical protein